MYLWPEAEAVEELVGGAHLLRLVHAPLAVGAAGRRRHEPRLPPRQQAAQLGVARLPLRLVAQTLLVARVLGHGALGMIGWPLLAIGLLASAVSKSVAWTNKLRVNYCIRAVRVFQRLWIRLNRLTWFHTMCNIKSCDIMWKMLAWNKCVWCQGVFFFFYFDGT